MSLQRDPIAKRKVAALSGKLIAEWRDKRLKNAAIAERALEDLEAVRAMLDKA